MRQRIVITDVTQMPQWEDVCVVGINEKGETIRPVCEQGFKKSYCVNKGKAVIYPKAVIDIDIGREIPVPPHREDRCFEPRSISFVRECQDKEWEQLLIKSGFSSVEEIFSGCFKEYRYVLPGTGNRSIATLVEVRIHAFKVEEREGKIKPRLVFSDGSARLYDFAVNDLSIRDMCRDRIKSGHEETRNIARTMTDYFRNATKVFLRIGLARPFPIDDVTELRCYPQVTGIYLIKCDQKVTNTCRDIASQQIYSPYDSMDNDFADSVTKYKSGIINGRTNGYTSERPGHYSSIEILELLAYGIGPFSGELIHNESPFNNPDVIRALFLAKESLCKDEAASKRNNRRKPANAGKSWSKAEDEQLIEEYKKRMPINEIAKIHGRTQTSINTRLIKLGFLDFN